MPSKGYKLRGNRREAQVGVAQGQVGEVRWAQDRSGELGEGFLRITGRTTQCLI